MIHLSKIGRGLGVAIAVCAGLLPHAQTLAQTQSAHPLEIPQCIGWNIACASHAPHASLTFSATGVDITYLTGANSQTQIQVQSSYSASPSSQGAAQFTTGHGVSGTIGLAAGAGCSDGHFFDQAPYEITLTSVPAAMQFPTGWTFCCELTPQ